ncbi:MAG TPA: ATP-grasp domain-containing protein [Nocardioidaceae bacterium]
MSTLLVLGGADGALGTIGAASRLGVRTLCVDSRTDAPGIARADEFLSVSTRDIGAIERAIAGRDDLQGVISPASDVNLPAQFELAQRLGLPNGLSIDAVRASIDKGFFRDVCARIGLVNPSYVQGTFDHVLCHSNALRWPVMVKPADSSGGRGVSRCDNVAQLAAACIEAAAWSRSRTVIVEEFVAGDDVGAEAFVIDGRVALLAIGSRTLTDRPHFVTTETRVALPDQRWEAVRRCLDAICAELGYRWGSLNADLIVRPDGAVVVVEIGARLGGNGSAELLGLAHGIDASEVAVELAVGAKPEVRPVLHRHAASRILGAPSEGKLVAIDGVGAARAVPGISQVVLAAEAGDHVAPYTKAGAKLGYLLAAGATADAVGKALDRAHRLLTVRVAHPDLDRSEQ